VCECVCVGGGDRVCVYDCFYIFKILSAVKRLPRPVFNIAPRGKI
jgi:hypothetical protein